MPVDTTLPLRDIHLPNDISWWPPAVGWWIVTGLLLLLIALVVWLYRRYQGHRLQREALQALNSIQDQFDNERDEQRLIQSLSVWLRRVCISYYPAAEVAGLTGIDWLQFLDKNLSETSSPQAFSEGVGRLILSAPYRKRSTVNGPELLALCRTWIMKFPGQNSSKGRSRD